MNLFLMFAEAEGVISDFVANVFPVARLVLLIIITLCALVLIVTTLMQSSAKPAGSSAITGGASETYFSQNKDNSRDGKLKRITIWMASILVVCVILYFVTGFWLAF